MLSLRSGGWLEVRGSRDDGAQTSSDSTTARSWLVAPGDLVLNPMWLEGGGVAVSSVAGSVSPDYRVFKVDESKVDGRYLHHLLRSQPYRDQYALYTRADTTFDRRVSRATFASLPVLTPPLVTQRRIADMLDTETARIDTLLDKNERILSLLNERETSEITRAVMGEFNSGSDPCPFPLVALRYRTRRIQAGVDFASSDLSMEASDGLVRYVRTTDIAAINRLTDTAVYVPATEVPDSALARDGDLLVTRAGSLGTAYVHRGEPVAVAGYLVRVQFDGSSDPDFYGYWCRSRPFLDAVEVGATQTTIQNFSASKYASLPAPAPPLETQRRVVALLDAEMANADALRSAVNRQQGLLRLRRQALISGAVTGQIEV